MFACYGHEAAGEKKLADEAFRRFSKHCQQVVIVGEFQNEEKQAILFYLLEKKWGQVPSASRENASIERPLVRDSERCVARC